MSSTFRAQRSRIMVRLNLEQGSSNLAMSRRHFLQASLVLTGLTLLSGCGLSPLPGQQASRVPRIGFLTAGSLASDAAWIEAFRQGLRELGYVEGQSIAIEYRYGEGKTERYPARVT